MYSVHARPFRCALHVVAVVIHVRPSVRGAPVVSTDTKAAARLDR